MSFQLSIITPEGTIFNGQIESLRAPGTLGGFGVLSGHVPMITTLKEGLLKLKQSAQDKYFTIGPGVLEINQQHDCLLLCDSAFEAKDVENLSV